MTLSFPNPSRNFDFSLNAVSFVGYDGLAVITFSVAAEALAHSNDGEYSPDQCLIAFDHHIELIHNLARNAYANGRNTSNLIKATDFFANSD